jgi:hypothetical protein
MKRPKAFVQKMTVKTETIRPLDTRKLANVAGGYPPHTFVCRTTH